MLFATAYLWLGVICMLPMIYVLLSLSKYASLHFLAAFIAIVFLPCLALARTGKLKRPTRAKNLPKEGTVLRGLLLVMVISSLIWTALQVSLVVYVEAEYAAMRDSYGKLFLSYLETHRKEGVLGAAWNATLALKREYMGTYGQKVLIPSRLLQKPMSRHSSRYYRSTA